MLGSSFQEGASASGDMLQIQVTDVEPAVLYAALRWVYTDRVDADMPAEQLLQVSLSVFVVHVSTLLSSPDCLLREALAQPSLCSTQHPSIQQACPS